MPYNILKKQIDSLKLLVEKNLLSGFNLGLYKNSRWQEFSFGLTEIESGFNSNPNSKQSFFNQAKKDYPNLNLNFNQPNKTCQNTYYDIASLTKTFTATWVLLSIQNNLLALGDPACKYLSFLEKFPQITIQDLLTHQTGLEIVQKYDKNKNYSTQEIQDLLFNSDNLCLKKFDKKYKYNDLNYLFLGKVLEKIYNQKLNEIANKFLEKYKIPEVLYAKDLAKLQPSNIKITKAENNLKLCEVQDEKARWLGSLAGHAGMFATNFGLRVFAEKWLKNEFNLDEDLYQKAFCNSNFRPINLDKDEAGFGLVFRVGWLSIFPNHAGFSGPFMSLDFEKQSAICFTTNHHFPVRNQYRRNHILAPIYRELIKLGLE